MRTKLIIVALMAIMPLMTGCKEEIKSETRSTLSLTIPYQGLSGDTSRIRFNQVKKKDEMTLAMEKVAGQWNRNLYLMGGGPSLAEYAGSCGAENQESESNHIPEFCKYNQKPLQ
jgi:hypothetical protein